MLLCGEIVYPLEAIVLLFAQDPEYQMAGYCLKSRYLWTSTCPCLMHDFVVLIMAEKGCKTEKKINSTEHK